MSDESSGGTPAGPTDDLDFDQAWMSFTQALSRVLSQMSDPNEDDHLILKLPDPEGNGGCAPYAQFVGFDDGQMIRAEISGEAYLSPSFLGGGLAARWMTMMAWSGNDGSDANWFKELPVTQAADLAQVTAASLREGFGIAHPSLLSYNAWGPSLVRRRRWACGRSAMSHR